MGHRRFTHKSAVKEVPHVKMRCDGQVVLLSSLAAIASSRSVTHFVFCSTSREGKLDLYSGYKGVDSVGNMGIKKTKDSSVVV